MSKRERKINELLTRLKGGDKASFKELFDCTYNHLESVAACYLTDKTEAEDVVMTAYAKIFRYVGSVDTRRNGYGWMCKIVQNTAYDFNEKQYQTISLEAVLSKPEIIRRKDSLLLDEWLEKGDLYEAIESLSSTEQEIVYYRYWEELSYEDIAERMNMKKTTVYDALKRIVKIISEKI